MPDAEAMIVIASVIGAFLAVRAFILWRFPKARDTHGTARFTTLWEATRLRLFSPW